VPYNLTIKQKEKRVNYCMQNLAKFNEKKWRLGDIMTGDESWIYHRAIGQKQSNAAWVAEGDPPKTVQKRNQFEPKSMFTIFFKSTGVVLIDVMETGKTINAKYYKEKILMPALDAIRMGKTKGWNYQFQNFAR
jgi:hypothetical protein